MNNLALPRIQKMKPYTPPLEGRRSYDGYLLDFNERTSNPSLKIRNAIKKYISNLK